MPGGAKKMPSEAFAPSKNCSDVVFERSTSLKTEPNPRESAGVVLPGRKKLTSITLLAIAVNSRCALNVSKVPV